jgi:hypothetical protein
MGPGYWKDVLAATEHPVQYGAHATHPLLGWLVDFLNNRDFHNVEMQDERAQPLLRLLQVLQDFAEQWQPVSYTQAQEAAREGRGREEQAERFFGQVPTPAWMTRSEAENLLNYYLRRRLPAGPMSRADWEDQQLKRDLVAELRGQVVAGVDLGDAIERGKLSPRALLALTRRANRVGLQGGFAILPMADALDVYEHATPGERNDLRLLLVRKLKNMLAHPPAPAVQEALRPRLLSAFELPVEAETTAPPASRR